MLDKCHDIYAKQNIATAVLSQIPGNFKPYAKEVIGSVHSTTLAAISDTNFKAVDPYRGQTVKCIQGLLLTKNPIMLVSS